MGELVDLNDRHEERVGSPFLMPTKPGSHCAYARGPELVVEWYDFGPHAPYESANLPVFDGPAQRRLAEAVGVDL